MHQDRLSELPLPLIHHILSFLPFRDVVSTTLISKHWVNLWTTVPCISICQDDERCGGEKTDVEESESFREFVNGALRRWKGTKLQKFIIGIYDPSLYDDAYAWTLFGLKYKVEELEIYASPDPFASLIYWIPQDLYSCSSIRKLLLVCNVGFHGSVSWNQLKSLTLKLDQVHRDCGCDIEDLVNQIMLGSPVLEVCELVLDLEHTYVNLDIMSRSLKRLGISISVINVEGKTSLHALSISCPNIETLEISGLFKCVFTDVSSLTDANFTFYSLNGESDIRSWIELFGESLMQIFSAIQNVEKLALTGLCVQAFGASRKKYLLPPLPNVKFLELRVVYRPFEFGNMIDLLGIFPNLKNVIFEDLAFRKPPLFNTVNYMDSETNASKSFLLQLKIVEIMARSPISSFYGFIEFLLIHSIMLEKLVIGLYWINLSEQKMFLEKVQSMPRSSKTVEVVIFKRN